MTTHRIPHDDFNALEDAIVAIMERHSAICNEGKTRSNFNTIKRVLSNARWHYGPYIDVIELTEDDVDRMMDEGGPPPKGNE